MKTAAGASPLLAEAPTRPSGACSHPPLSRLPVDLVYANVGPKLQRFIDVFATLVLLFVVSFQTWTLFDKVLSTRADNVLTFDLRLPTWPFFLVAWLGDVSAVLLIAVRTYRLIFQPELMGGQYQIKPVE